jgi:tetratricopeptide (TPR) repeat protein
MQSASRSRAREWSRSAFALGLLFASLPVAARLLLGDWAFRGAFEVAAICFLIGAYLHLLSRGQTRSLPDGAAMVERAFRLAYEGRMDAAMAMLSQAIRLNPRFWQAYQYRGELSLRRNAPAASLEDFNEAIRLAPDEPQLYVLRGQAHALLGNEAAASADYELAARMGSITQ